MVITDPTIINTIDSNNLISGVTTGATVTFNSVSTSVSQTITCVAGRGELCYRDIEYMALEVPFIRFEYITKLNPNLIPNFHYISVERPDELTIDRLGDESHSKMIERRFLEVKDDMEFLEILQSTNE